MNKKTETKDVSMMFSLPQRDVDVAELIVTAREWAGLSQNDLGRLVGIDGNQVSRIECGRSMPKWETFMLILATCGVKLDVKQGPQWDVTP